MLLSSYRKKLIGMFTLIALIPIILFAISVYSRINNYIIEENLKARTSLISNEAEKIDMWFMVNAERVNDISASYPFIKTLMNESDGDRRISEYLDSQLASSQEIVNIRLVMMDSRQYSSRNVNFPGNPQLRNDYITAMLEEKLVWTLQDYENGQPSIITASVPFFDADRQMEGVLLVDFNFDGILNRINEMKREDKSIDYVLTKQGRILNVFGEENIDLGKVGKDYEEKISELVQKTINTYTGRESVNLDKDYLVFYSTVNSVDWKIMRLVPSHIIYDSLSVLIKYVAFITGVSLVLVVILAMLFSGIFSEPLLKLKNGAIEIQNGNYDYKFEVEKEDEFGQVAMAFNDMAAKLSKSYKDLSDNNAMLVETNEQLQEMNIELEASYEQLKATTDLLNESEQRFRTLLGNIDDLVWIMDRDLNVVFTNDQVESVLKVNKERFLGRNLSELISHILEDGETFLRDIFEIDLKNRQVQVTYSSKDIAILEVSTKRVYEGGSLAAIHGVIRDITERKRMEESIIKRNEELVVINRVSKGLTTAMNIDTLMQRAADGISKIMNISFCAIRILEDEKLVLKAFSGGESSLISLIAEEAILPDGDEIGEVVRTGKIKMLELSKYNDKKSRLADLANYTNVNYLNVLPIKARVKTSGIMIIGSKDKLDKGEYSILASISNQIALIRENISLYQGLKDNYLKTIKTLAAAIEAKDEYTEGHSNRVAKYALEIAKYMGMPKKFCEEIEVAGMLHDIGKIGIKDGVLSKAGRLTEKEYEMIRKHPIIGSKILENVGFSETIMNAIKFHHKRYDLKGYPEEIYIEELPLEAAIIGVADAFDAMTTSRAYRSAITVEEALKELEKYRGTQFNPYIVDIMIDIHKRDKQVIEAIMGTENYKEQVSLA